MSHSADKAPRRAEASDTKLKLHCAAALGAVCLGLVDLLNNSEAAASLKLGEVIRQYLVPGLESGGLVAFVVLALLGIGLCWVRQPGSRFDAFTTGFSVFAILAVATPYQQRPTGLDEGAVGESEPVGVARPLVPEEARAGRARPEARFVLAAQGARAPVEKDDKATHVAIRLLAQKELESSLVVLRDPSTARILGYARVEGSDVKLVRSSGEYLVEVEASGFRRVQFRLKLEDSGSESYVVKLQQSAVPLALQRLVAAKPVQAVAISDSPPDKL